MKLEKSQLRERIEFLKTFAMFAELSDVELEGLSRVTEDLELEPGVRLLAQNEPADAVYFLQTGAVKILVNGEMVAQVDKAQCFGEVSCLTPDTPATATVVTAKKSHLIRIKKGDFLTAVNQITTLWKMLFLQTSERVRAANGRLSEILNHLPQGLAKVSPEGIVSNDYSIQCTKFFHRENIAGLSFAKLAFPDDEAKQRTWTENLGLLFTESNLSFVSCAELLAREFTLQTDGETRSFALTYQPCKNVHGKLVAVDVGIEDVTRQRELERKHAEIKLKQEMMAKITQSPDTFINFLALSEEAFSETAGFLRDLRASGPSAVLSRIELLMRKLHSLKGLAGVFVLHPLKQVVHESESLVGMVKSAGEGLAQVAQSLEEKLAAFKAEKDKAQAVFEEIPPDLRKRLAGVVLSQAEFQAVKDLVGKNDTLSIVKLLSSLEKVDGKRLFAAWPEEAMKIADSLGKQLQFSVAGEGGRIGKDLFAQLDKVLIHLLRNGLDHGLEMPEERERAGKSPMGHIVVTIDAVESELLIAFEDDGRGLNREALAARARTKPDLDQTLVEKHVAAKEEWRILLMPGFSTAAQVTDLSGRGVGLDAVASAITELGGTLAIDSTDGSGMCIFITAPI